MPPSGWKYNTGAILEVLRRHPPGPLDREDIEALFHVKQRRAKVLMHLFGAKTPAPGWNMTIDRDRLIASLEVFNGSADIALSDDRREMLELKLDGLRQARGTPFADFRMPVGRAAYGCRFENLPAGIRFEASRLIIDYSDATELLAKLFALSQAAANDLDQWVEAAERGLDNPKALSAG
jgi:hypothetical protein